MFTKDFLTNPEIVLLLILAITSLLTIWFTVKRYKKQPSKKLVYIMVFLFIVLIFALYYINYGLKVYRFFNKPTIEVVPNTTTN